MADPRQIRTLLKLAKEFGLDSINVQSGDFQLQASFNRVGASKEDQVVTRKQLERKERPALDSFKEKAPFFDWGLKA